jgi:mRNA interferase MazF
MTLPSKVEIWRINLPDAKGHEQRNERPAIIWKDLDHVKMAVAIPLTTNPERDKLPYTHTICTSAKNRLDADSVALVFQIRAIDKKRLSAKIGELEDSDIKCIADILKQLLRL